MSRGLYAACQNGLVLEDHSHGLLYVGGKTERLQSFLAENSTDCLTHRCWTSGSEKLIWPRNPSTVRFYFKASVLRPLRAGADVPKPTNADKLVSLRSILSRLELSVAQLVILVVCP
jgi:hypothetical protein